MRGLLDQLERDGALERPERLRERVDAVDRLDRLSYYLDESAQAAALRERVRAIEARLEAANESLYQDLREAIGRGDGASRLREWMPGVAQAADANRGGAEGEGYDYLDVLLGGVLQLREPDEEPAELAAELVFYQPTPARHIFDLIARLDLSEGDVLLDLGSGLGHVPLLVGACTAARCIGVELEPVYAASARSAAEALGLSKVSFVQADARVADLSQATVFYLYTPFTGGVLDQMLTHIRRESEQRILRVCSLGPCTRVLAEQSWLRALDTELRGDRVAIFESR